MFEVAFLDARCSMERRNNSSEYMRIHTELTFHIAEPLRAIILCNQLYVLDVKELETVSATNPYKNCYQK